MPPRDLPEPRAIAALSWPIVPGLMPIWYAGIAGWWWREIHRQILAAAAGDSALTTIPAASTAWVALGSRVLSTLSEALIYTLWWRSRDLRLPFFRFLAWVASFSVADLFGSALVRASHDSTGVVVRWTCASLAGPAALHAPDAATSGFMAAFGTLGMLTTLRVGMTAWAAARGLERPLRGPLTLTAIAWLLTRLSGWWSFDLMKGLSPLR